jgi:hypothetical protein
VSLEERDGISLRAKARRRSDTAEAASDHEDIRRRACIAHSPPLARMMVRMLEKNFLALLRVSDAISIFAPEDDMCTRCASRQHDRCVDAESSQSASTRVLSAADKTRIHYASCGRKRRHRNRRMRSGRRSPSHSRAVTRCCRW